MELQIPYFTIVSRGLFSIEFVEKYCRWIDGKYAEMNSLQEEAILSSLLINIWDMNLTWP